MQVVLSKIRLMQRLSVWSVKFPSVYVCVSNCGLLIIAFMLTLELHLSAGRMRCVFVPEVIQQELSNPPASRDLWCLHVSLSAHNLFSSEESLTFWYFVCLFVCGYMMRSESEEVVKADVDDAVLFLLSHQWGQNDQMSGTRLFPWKYYSIKSKISDLFLALSILSLKC